MADPVDTNPDLYRVVLENERVRILEYRDTPGDCTAVHAHPDSVMVPLGSFRRRLHQGGRAVEVDISPGVRWLDAQEHRGTNIGDTASHALFIELKEPRPGVGGAQGDQSLGPAPTA